MLIELLNCARSFHNPDSGIVNRGFGHTVRSTELDRRHIEKLHMLLRGEDARKRHSMKPEDSLFSLTKAPRKAKVMSIAKSQVEESRLNLLVAASCRTVVSSKRILLCFWSAIAKCHSFARHATV